MRVEHRIVINAAQDEVWRQIANPEHHPRFIDDFSRLERHGKGSVGIGAEYSIRLRVGAAHPGGLVEIVEYEPNWELAWTSVTGLEHRLRWRIRPAGNGRSRVTLRLIYRTPGMWGPLTDRLAALLLDGMLERWLRSLKELVEAEGSTTESQPTLTERLLAASADVATLTSAGVLRAMGPTELSRSAAALARWGFGPQAAYAISSVHSADRPAIVDEAGEVMFREADRQSSALAAGLQAGGVRQGDAVGILCRNHRWFVLTLVALSKLGARSVLLNTAFGGPQLTEAIKREGVKGVVLDSEFLQLVPARRGLKRWIAWQEDGKSELPALEDVVAETDSSDLRPGMESGGFVILTSGTGGAPKGAKRSGVAYSSAVPLLAAIPLQSRETTLIASPLFHSWGFAHLMIGLLLSSTVVLQRRFDAEQVLAAIERERVTALIVVPVMMQRILDLPARRRRKYDTSSLEVVAVSGSALSGDLSGRFMDEFGDVVYNLYGSTEVAWVSIASPDDLRAAPGTAGKAPRRTRLAILDEAGTPLPAGQAGRIFAANAAAFDGYTTGGGKEVVGDLMATGDVGYVDSEGRLFVTGRSDAMIVSGGENVYPEEIEDVLARHPAIADVAVTGIDDPEFGQALAAYIVRKPRARLSVDAVKSYVRTNLSRHKVPRQVHFVKTLPRNPSGKVVRSELSQAS
jgi:acyl-CoA synthetase (AMP-forming)/AMP-acid ligase II